MPMIGIALVFTGTTEYTDGGGYVPPGDALLTEAGENIVTENGDKIITES